MKQAGNEMYFTRLVDKRSLTTHLILGLQLFGIGHMINDYLDLRTTWIAREETLFDHFVGYFFYPTGRIVHTMILLHY